MSGRRASTARMTPAVSPASAANISISSQAAMSSGFSATASSSLDWASSLFLSCSRASTAISRSARERSSGVGALLASASSSFARFLKERRRDRMRTSASSGSRKSASAL